MTGTLRNRSSKNLAAGSFQPVINSFALHLRAEDKSSKTVRTYVEAAGWFAAEDLRRYVACARSARARRTYDRIMDDA